MVTIPRLPITEYGNHLNSAALELNEKAETISYEEYHPFGTASYQLHDNQTDVSSKRYRYCGKERDEESGLYYYGARYYATWLCRFMSVDPLKDKFLYWSSFQYAGNNPVTFMTLMEMKLQIMTSQILQPMGKIILLVELIIRMLVLLLSYTNQFLTRKSTINIRMTTIPLLLLTIRLQITLVQKTLILNFGGEDFRNLKDLVFLINKKKNLLKRLL